MPRQARAAAKSAASSSTSTSSGSRAARPPRRAKPRQAGTADGAAAASPASGDGASAIAADVLAFLQRKLWILQMNREQRYSDPRGGLVCKLTSGVDGHVDVTGKVGEVRIEPDAAEVWGFHGHRLQRFGRRSNQGHLHCLRPESR